MYNVLSNPARRAVLPAISEGPVWDERVESWEKVAGSPAFRRFANAVCALAQPRPDDEVVDLGAGTGLLTFALASRVRSVTALDSSGAMLDRLGEKTTEARLANVRPLLADLRCLPLPDESVSLAVSNYAFHHLADDAKELALSEVRRVLAPGGRLVICDMMFGLSLSRRDRQVILEKLLLLARRGPGGLLRIVKNGVRIASRSWEYPAPASQWELLLARRRFSDISVRLLEHEAGIAFARRPDAPPGAS